MIWTTEKPTKPGIYWRDDDSGEPRLVIVSFVAAYGHELELEFTVDLAFSYRAPLLDYGRWSDTPIDANDLKKPDEPEHHPLVTRLMEHLPDERFLAGWCYLDAEEKEDARAGFLSLVADVPKELSSK